ncbi:MAG: hypothetical protein KA717_20015 [Woronichinia naegeliana WA131]|uniref:Uncharacterized protein n=1 Tax=Woronichinia naegeliana WA131 TaxID=2824559 RepID=A0A977PU86_9CYAN|nr:MAG: hypothetical protein KA717_20015 [Woronichinia naegeliana WA131]
MIEKFTDNQSLKVVGKLLGITEGTTVVLDSEEELNFVMDFSIFEYQVEGKNFVQRYQEDETAKKTEIETEILAAQGLSYTSLFKITETDPVNATVTLSDLLNNNQELKIININLSQTAYPGLLIFTRIEPFADFNAASGMYALFPEVSERSLLKKMKIMMRKVKSDVESVQRFVAFFKLNRKEGLMTKTAEV